MDQAWRKRLQTDSKQLFRLKRFMDAVFVFLFIILVVIKTILIHRRRPGGKYLLDFLITAIYLVAR